MRTPAAKTVPNDAGTPDSGRRSGTLYLVHVLTHATRTRLDVLLAPLGLSSFQSTLLSVIARNEGLSSSRLSRRFHVTPQAMGETIATLERKGFVERRDDPADRKILHLLLTPAGAEVVAAAEKIVGGFERSLLDGFPAQDVGRMRQMLSDMLATLGDRPRPGGEGSDDAAKRGARGAAMKIAQACAVLATMWLTPAMAQEAAPVRIGVLVDASGIFSSGDGNGSILGATMAVEDFGKSVLGRPVEIVPGDHQNKPDIGAGLAREWYAQRGVTAIAGGANSAVAFAVQDLARNQDRIFLNVNGTSSDLSNKACSPNSIYWGIDTYALAKVTGTYFTKAGIKRWYFITADYTFGHTLQRDTAQAVTNAGGSVVGDVVHPLNNSDFAGQILAAQSVASDGIGFADAGDDFTNAMKAAAQFGLAASGRKLVGLLVLLANLQALGPDSQGLLWASPGEWTSTPATEAWSRRFMQRSPQHMPPAPGQIAMYGAVRHYLRAVQAAGTVDAAAVMAMMKSMPTDDFATAGSRVRVDGRLIFPVHINTVKDPAEVRFPFDLVKEIATVPGEEAFRPLSDSQCPLVKKTG